MASLCLQFIFAWFFVLGIFLCALSLSRVFPGRWFDSSSPVLTILIRSATGLLLLSTMLFVLFSFQAGSISNLRVLAWLAWFVGAGEAVERIKQGHLRFSRRTMLVFFGAGVFLTAASFWSVLPASEKDELIYHLEIPRQMLARGRWFLGADNIYAGFPHFVELLFSMGLAALGEATAKIFHALFGALLAVTLFDYARKHLSSFWSWASVLMLMTVPTVTVMMAWAYVDLAFAWFVLLSWVCLEQGFGAGEKKWVFFAGLFCGAACCVKYTGIQWTLLLGAFILLRGFYKRKAREAAGFAAVLSVMAGLVFAPYLARNYILTGWPLYPFSVLDLPLRPGLNWDLDRTQLFLEWIKTFGAPLGAHPFSVYGLALIRVFTDGEFNNADRFDGVIGPFFLAIPLFYLFRKMKNFPRALAVITLLFLYYWLMTTRQARFLVPVLPFLSFMLAYGLSTLPKKVAGLFLALCLMVNMAGTFQFWAQKQPWNYLAGRESREDYLTRQHRVFAMYVATNRFLPKGARVYLIHMKNYGYYLDVPWAGDFIFERYRIEQLLKQPFPSENLSRFFLGKRITHLLVDRKPLRAFLGGLDEAALAEFDDYLKNSAQPLVRQGEITLYALKLPN